MEGKIAEFEKKLRKLSDWEDISDPDKRIEMISAYYDTLTDFMTFLKDNKLFDMSKVGNLHQAVSICKFEAENKLMD